MENYKVILASKSPRRRDILTNAGYEFTIIEADIDENVSELSSPAEAVTDIALQKAVYIKNKAQETKNTIIIAADTMVLKDGILLGKPNSKEEAFYMLKALSGEWHEVYTGYVVLCGEQRVMGCEVTSVKFRALKDKEIYAYIDSGEPFDKAGSYGIQGRACAFVEQIQGDFFNVIGLPICKISLIVDDFVSDIYT